jgi:peptidyl-prolyl cis-trans isomerase SurA
MLRRSWVLALAVAVAVPSTARAEEVLVDGIAAQVGTEVVLISEVGRISAPLEQQMRQQGATDADVTLLRADVLDRLIDRRLVALVAKRNEIAASDAEIEEAVAGVAHDNGMDVAQLQKTVAAEGLSWDLYRRKLAEEIVQQKVVGGAVRSRVAVDKTEIEKAYQQRYGDQAVSGQEVQVQHIAVAAENGKPAAMKAACDRVRAAMGRVRAGEPFLEVARQVTEGSPDLGWLAEANLAPWMLETLAGMQPGSVSGVVELPVGCAALKLVERREAQPVSYEQAHDEIRAAIAAEKFEQEYERFLEKLRKQTYVERKGAFADAVGSGVSAGAEPPPLR